MKRRIYLSLLAAVLLGGLTGSGMAQEQHVIASPNPRVEESAPARVVPGELKASKIPAVSAVKATPLKARAKARRKKPRPS